MELVPSNSSKTHIQYEEEEQSVCRICLLDMSQKEISEESSGICECREKGKHVHEDCLKEWLRIWVIQKNKQKEEINGKYHVPCEICGKNIWFQANEKMNCKSFKQTIQIIKKDCLSFIAMVFAFICLSVLCLLGLAFTFQQYKKSERFQKAAIGYLLLATFCLLGLSMWAFVFIRFFIYRKKVHVRLTSEEESLKSSEDS